MSKAEKKITFKILLLSNPFLLENESICEISSICSAKSCSISVMASSLTSRSIDSTRAEGHSTTLIGLVFVIPQIKGI